MYFKPVLFFCQKIQFINFKSDTIKMVVHVHVNVHYFVEKSGFFSASRIEFGILVFSQHAGCLDIEYTDNSTLKPTGKYLSGRVVRYGTGAFIGCTEIIQLKKKARNDSEFLFYDPDS